MSEKELNSYRFLSQEDPSDEMLAQIMSEVTTEALERKKKSDAKYHAEMERQRALLKSRWDERIKKHLNG